MKIVNGFVEPIVTAAVAKELEMKRIRGEVEGEADIEQGIEEVMEGESLLDHLVKFTSG
jgi:hypothetical protein